MTIVFQNLNPFSKNKKEQLGSRLLSFKMFKTNKQNIHKLQIGKIIVESWSSTFFFNLKI